MTFKYYTAAGWVETDEAFGQVWQDAKAYAAQVHGFIERFKIRNDEEPIHEIYSTASTFLPAKAFSGARALQVKVF